MRKKFVVEVPCTGVDRYIVFAKSEDDARRKMASGSMLEHSKEKPGDYVWDMNQEEHFSGDHEPETHWDRAVIVREVAA